MNETSHVSSRGSTSPRPRTRALRGPFPYRDLRCATKTEKDSRVFPMKVTLGPTPMFSRASVDSKDEHVVDPMLVHANVTRDGSEIGIVVIGRAPMWWEDGGVARLRTADFVAAVRSRSGRHGAWIVRRHDAGSPYAATRIDTVGRRRHVAFQRRSKISMVPTMNLPEGMRASDLSARLQCALEELDSIEPTRYALAHWMTGAYRATLEGGGGQRWAFVLPLPTEIATMLGEAKAAVAKAREAARSLDGRIVDSLPDRVHVVRVKDASGATGFAPIDVKHATLKERVLSVLLADYLMRPEAYVAEARAPEVTLPELDVVP